MWFNFNIPLLYSDRYKGYKVHGDAPGPGIVLRTTHAYSLIGFESLDSFNFVQHFLPSFPCVFLCE